MRILALYGEDYPWDVRVDKLLSGLATRGHEVMLLCRNLQGAARQEQVGKIACRRLTAPNLPANLAGVVSTPAFFNPIWKRELKHSCNDFQPDVLMVRDLPLAPLAVQVAAARGLPVVVDFAENHPAMWQNVCRNSRHKLRAYLTKNPRYARWMEKYVVTRGSHFFVVVEEMVDHLVAQGADASGITLVSNTPDQNLFSNRSELQVDERVDPTADGVLNLIYVGYLTRARGLQSVVEAMSLLRQRSPELIVNFHVVGSGLYEQRLAQRVQKLGLADRVRFHGWVEHGELPGIIAVCDIGVIPHRKTEHTDTTVPNKLFDFMACEKPVLVTNTRPMERIVQNEQCGLVFVDGDTAMCADCILELSNPSLRTNMGTNGRRAVQQRYNWHIDMDRAVVALESLDHGVENP